MNIYVINLDVRQDRLAFISKQLQELDLEFERISGVNGKEVYKTSTLFSKKRFFLENQQHCVAGEVGCAQSHINIWESIVTNDIDYAVVLEDDVYLSPDIKSFLASKSVFSEFDYLKIDDCHLHKGVKVSQGTSLKHSLEKYDGNIFSVKGDGLFQTIECDPVPYGTGGYLISNYGAKQFLKVSKNMYYPIDLLPRYASGNVRQGFLSHALTVPIDLTDSDIGKREKGIAFSITEKLLRVVHKVFNRRRLRQMNLFFMYKKS